MSSIFSHIFIPITILLIFSNRLKLDPKKIVILSFFGILPDLDAYIFIHRAFLHNIFILVIPILIYLIIKDLQTYYIVSFYLASHIILDIFNGGVFLFYPFYDNVFFSRIELLFSDGNIISSIYYGINDKIVPIGRKEAMITSENVGTIILLIIITLSLYIRNLINKKYRKEIDIEKKD